MSSRAEGLPGWIYPVERLVLSDSVGEWCKLPYPGHPKGCPKYGEADRCPPHAPRAGDYFDLQKPLWLVHSEFDLAGHAARMGALHPKWSDRQRRCVLYWQPKSRKQLMARLLEAREILGFTATATTPEAMGVNIYATARLSGLELERIRHLSTCKHVALVGSVKEV